MFKKLYFPFVLTIEIAILIGFLLFLVYLFPTLDPQGYQYYGEAPHVAFLEQEISNPLVIVVRWVIFFLTAALLLPMMGTIILELIRWQINQGKKPENVSEIETQNGEKQVVRFDIHLKLVHYLVMIFATLGGILGLAQVFPDWPFANWFVEQVLGGIEAKRHFHHYFGYFTDFAIFYYIGYLINKFFFKKEKPKAMLFSLQDLKDFIHMNLYILGIDKEEPKYGRYTFGQKIDFFIIAIGLPSLSLTGLAMGYPSIFGVILPDVGIALAAIIHRSLALFLAWFILSVHFYYGHLAPDMFPINTVILTGKMPKSKYKALFPLDKERLQE